MHGKWSLHGKDVAQNIFGSLETYYIYVRVNNRFHEYSLLIVLVNGLL